MSAKRPSWKDIISKRREENFVGRADYLRSFSANFTTEVPAFLLFFVTGEGGVGKSTLLKQFEATTIDQNVKANAIICDDEFVSPVAVMGNISERLAKFEIRSKEFDEQYKTYRTRKEEIESDPKAPRGALNLVVRGMTDFAIKATRHTPGVGVFAEYIDEKDASEALVQGVNYLIDRIGNKDEVELLREPERILTPLFIDLLNKACEKGRIVLMFDVFERTREALEPWLLEFINFKYGEFDAHLTLVISGRDSANQRWTQIASSICYITLEPFTQEETGIYLSHRGIIDEQLIAQIHEDTGGLPVLVELLAGTNPQPSLPLPDISKDAVKRFLQWIPEEERRRVALLAAVPRNFNLDVLSAVLDNNAAGDFNWLSIQSYIRTSTTRGWFYHEKVRELMLRYLRNTTPGDLTAAHARLARFFETQQNRLGLVNETAYSNESWRKLEGERIYHSLCEQSKGSNSVAQNAFLRAFRWRWSLAENIIQAYEQAAHEMASHEMQNGVRVLSNFYQASKNDEHERLINQASILAQRNDIEPIAQATVFGRRGDTYRLMDKYEQALADLDHAIALDEKYAWAIGSRGAAYLKLDKHEQALADFDRAIALDERYIWAIANRGVTYLQMDKHEQALADFDRAIALDDQNVALFANRGVTYQEMGMHEQALADFDRAIELDGHNASFFANRGVTYQEMGKHEQALADFDRAIELDNQYHWAHELRGVTLGILGRLEEAVDSLTLAEKIDPACNACLANRGITYRKMGWHEQALADFDSAISLGEQSDVIFANRGATNLQMGKHEQALADFDRAITLNEQYTWAIGNRGVTYLQMGNYERAFTDFDRAIDLDDGNASIFTNRGVAYLETGNYEQALSDFNQAINLDATEVRAIARRGDIYRLMGKYPEALADIDRAIELSEKFHWAHKEKGYILRDLQRYEDAIASFTVGIQIDPNCSDCIMERGNTYLLNHQYAEALADFDRAIALDDQNASIFAHRGRAYHEMGQYEQALADLDRAIMLNDQNASNFATRGVIYRLMGRHEQAFADFDRAITLDDQDASIFANRGVAFREMDQYEQALADFNRAIAFDDQNASILTNRGLIYRLIGRHEQALADFGRAIAIDDRSASTFASRGETYLAKSNYDLALADFERAIALYGNNDWFFYLRSLTYQLAGSITNAHEDITVATKLASQEFEQHPQDWQNRLNLAVYLLAGGQFESSMHLYQETLTLDLPLSFIRGTIRDLDQLLSLFADHQQALTIRSLLQAYLDAHEHAS